MKHLLSEKFVFPFIFFFSIMIFLFHTTYTKTAVFSDGRFYYAITRSLVKDKDIKFTNEFENLGVTPTYTHDGYVWNKYPPGGSIFSIPLFFVADGLSNLIKLFSTHWGWITIDILGYGIIYQSILALSSIFLGTLGLYLVYKLLKDYFSEKISLLATFILFSTTNLLFYIAVEPINSHAISFFVSSFFIYYFIKHKNDKYYFLILGSIGGFAGLIRTQDILLLIIPVLEILIKNIRSHKKLITHYSLLTTGAILAFAPQIIFWKKIFDTYWYSPYLEEGFNFLKPQVLHLLFNIQNGLFTITPIVLISVLGLVILMFRFSNIAIYGLLYFLIQLYLISSWSGFYQGGSYSIRMIITTYPLLSFGFAQILKLLLKKIKLNIVYILAGILIILNNIFIIRYLISF